MSDINKTDLWRARSALMRGQIVLDREALRALLLCTLPHGGPLPDGFAYLLEPDSPASPLPSDDKGHGSEVTVLPDPRPIPGIGNRVALVIGHNSKAKGAFAVGPVGQFEYDFNSDVSHRISELSAAAGLEVRRFFRQASSNYAAEIDNCYRQVNAWEHDLTVEMHFNGGGGDYCLMLHASGSTNGAKAAKAMLSVFAKGLDIRAWGVQGRARGDRGGRSLWAAKPTAVMTEPFFGDHDQHTARVHELGVDGMARLYIAAIWEALKAIG